MCLNLVCLFKTREGDFIDEKSSFLVGSRYPLQKFCIYVRTKKYLAIYTPSFTIIRILSIQFSDTMRYVDVIQVICCVLFIHSYTLIFEESSTTVIYKINYQQIGSSLPQCRQDKLPDRGLQNVSMFKYVINVLFFSVLLKDIFLFCSLNVKMHRLFCVVI